MLLEETIQKEREKIVNGILIAYGAIIVLPVAASLVRISDIGWQPVMVLHLASWILCWIVILLRNRLSYVTKASFIILIFMSTGIFGVYQFGLVGNGMTFAIIAPVLAALFFNLRTALIMFSIIATSITIIGYYVVQTNYLPNFNLNAYAVRYKSWGDFLFAFIFVAGILTFTGALLIKRLIRILTEVYMLKNKAEEEVKILSNLLPICAKCKKIRDDTGYWNKLETYFMNNSEVQFSHGICPECSKELYPDLFEE